MREGAYLGPQYDSGEFIHALVNRNIMGVILTCIYSVDFSDWWYLIKWMDGSQTTIQEHEVAPFGE